MSNRPHIDTVESRNKEARRGPRLKVAVPFPCGFARVGLSRWGSAEKTGYGIVFDLSVKGARVMSPVSMSVGDTLAMSLRLPQQPTVMTVDATVRWHRDDSFGLEFSAISRTADLRLKKFLAQAGIFTALQA